MFGSSLFDIAMAQVDLTCRLMLKQLLANIKVKSTVYLSTVTTTQKQLLELWGKATTASQWVISIYLYFQCT